MAKYDGLRRYLWDSETSPWMASFEEVAELVPGGPPSSASNHPAWCRSAFPHLSPTGWFATYPRFGGRGTLNASSWAADCRQFAFVTYPTDATS